MPAVTRLGRSNCILGPLTGHPWVWKEPAERLPDSAKQSVDRGGERFEPETAQDPCQPPRGGEVFEESDCRRPVRHPHAVRLDELPRLTHLLLGDPRRVAQGRFVVTAQERESLLAIQSGDEPRRRTTERSAAVEQQERATGRRHVPEPHWIEHEAIRASMPTSLAPPHTLRRLLQSQNLE